MTALENIIKKYKEKTILVTGNTGFKGSWLTKILLNLGANVIGYSLKPSTEPNLYTISNLAFNPNLHQVYGDVRNLDAMKKTFENYKPEIVIHLAAQPIVRDSYKDPVNTYSTNVMGTVNICECVRLSHLSVLEGGLKSDDWTGVRSFLNVTTDKVYKNFEWEYGYREDDPLDGYDPYSNSKSCSELITHSYKDSFFVAANIGISTARAGNVIGGGDFSNDRIIPDCIKTMRNAVDKKIDRTEIIVRNPYSIRPYQHVLEPLFMYLVIAMKQYEDMSYAGYYNVGPDDIDCITTGRLVDLFCEKWNKDSGLSLASWKNITDKNVLHEASFLKLDCSRIKTVFNWKPKWHIEKAIEETVIFSKLWMEGKSVNDEMNREIEEYMI